MEYHLFLLEEIKRLQYRLEQLENQTKDNYCEICKRLYERLSYSCFHCGKRVCKYCCIKKSDQVILCPRKCCNKE